MLAVAVANGTIIIYQWQDPSNLTSFNEFREINLLPNGECTCLSWNPAFDEPMTLVVGCLIQSQEAGENDFSKLLQLICFNKDADKELDLVVPFNKGQHKQMINDVQWSPLSGRSFHMIVSCSKDFTVVLWRVIQMDLMNGELFEVPNISAV